MVKKVSFDEEEEEVKDELVVPEVKYKRKISQFKSLCLSEKEEGKNFETIENEIEFQTKHNFRERLGLPLSNTVIEYEPETIEIETIRFTMMTNDDALKMSVCHITESLYHGKNTVYDPRLGAVNTTEICETCGQGWKICPGHYGHIRLASAIPHPLCTKKILQYLRLFCFHCSRLVFTEDRLEILGKRTSLTVILELIEKSVNVCPHSECKKMLPEFTFDDDKFYYCNKDGSKYPLNNEQIWNIFDNVRECDISLLNLDSNWVHPRNCLIQILPVIPPCARPYVTSGDAQGYDDLTLKYIDIIKTNKKCQTVIGEKMKADVLEVLSFHIRTLMDNTKGKARDSSQKRPIKCFKKRLTGKQGLIRGNIEGKRANLNGRTVVGPEALGHVNELVIPYEVSKILTVPEIVTENNIEYCQKLVDDGKVNYVKRNKKNHDLKTKRKENEYQFGPWDRVYRNGVYLKPYEMSLSVKADPYKRMGYEDFKLQSGDVLYRGEEKIEYISPSRFMLKAGDVIERQLKNGDWLILNRQPTLWKGSMQAKQVRILPGKTFRFNLACTQAYNADYDKISVVNRRP
jgi:DNA-directed RNA polymerase beta' subunit